MSEQTEIDGLRTHLDGRFGEVHASLEGIRCNLGDIRSDQVDHFHNHAAPSATQATGVAAVVAAIVAAVGQLFGRVT